MSIPAHIIKLLKIVQLSATFHLSSRGIITCDSAATSDQTLTKYFYKTAPFPAVQLLGEAESIKRMSSASPGIVPKLLGSGEDDESGNAWFLSEWHDMGSLSAHEEELATLLAEMHSAPSTEGQSYGFPLTTCCGVTEQDNKEEESWSVFFGQRRIGDMLRRIKDPELSTLGEQVLSKVIPRLLDRLDIKPVILHGDLWSGNAGYSQTSSRDITFDPASYFGHSEADLGIMHMFGGFSPTFFRAYHDVVPKTEPVEEYEQRLKLYELYHHLNHLLMFGNSYKSGATRIMKDLMAWSDKQDPQ